MTVLNPSTPAGRHLLKVEPSAHIWCFLAYCPLLSGQEATQVYLEDPGLPAVPREASLVPFLSQSWCGSVSPPCWSLFLIIRMKVSPGVLKDLALS